MTTEWKWRLFFFVRAVDNTSTNRTNFANIFVNNGSGETLANERKMLDSAVRFSTDGNEPAVAFGINTAVKTSMRDDFITFLGTLTNARYVGVANTKLPNWEEGELVATNFNLTPNGQIVTWDDALTYIENEFGLIVIEPEESV